MPAAPGQIRYRVLFSGNVQGVGFRYTAAQVARGHAVGGFVRNQPDGRVELVAEGRDDALVGFVDEVKAEMAGYIRQVEVQREAATGEFSSFQIRH